MPHMPAEWSIKMLYTKNEVLQFVQENDVKFIRMAFCDIFGRMKNISEYPLTLLLLMGL